MLYTSTHAATLFHVSTETIRNWAEVFSPYLSVTANPGKGRTRSFTTEDMQVLALVAEMKSKGATFDEIHVALQNGQRGDPPPLMVEEVQAIITGEQEKKLSLEIEYLKRSLKEALARAQEAELAKAENIRLRAQLESVEKRVQELMEQMKTKDEQYQRSIAEAMRRIEELSRQIGEAYARGVMDTLREKGDLPKTNDPGES